MAKINYQNLKTKKDWCALWVATFLGSGLIPIAPGTAGTIAAIPLVYSIKDLNFLTQSLLWILIAIVGTLAAAEICKNQKSTDHQAIVIDEVTGFWLTMDAFLFFDISMTPLHWFVGFLLFRVLDVLKLPPVNWVDRWSKKQSRPLYCGLGVMLDDWIAGVQGFFIIFLLLKFGFL